jgi:hypothetical protein
MCLLLFLEDTSFFFLVQSMWYHEWQVQLSPQGGEVPRSLFQFDFDLERRILAEAESQGQSFSRKPADHSRQSNGGSVSLTTSFSLFLLM